MQYGLFVKLMPRLIPNAFAFAAKPVSAKLKDAAGLRGLFIQNFVENGINNPLLFFPLFYATQQFLDGGDVRDCAWLRKYAPPRPAIGPHFQFYIDTNRPHA